MTWQKSNCVKKKRREKLKFTNVILYEIADGARHPTRTYSEIAVFGTLPPKPISYNEFCPPPNCPEQNCDEYRCNNAYVHHDIEVRQLHFKDIRFPGVSNRSIGKFSIHVLMKILSVIEGKNIRSVRAFNWSFHSEMERLLIGSTWI